jgi:hypothetical protein
MGISVSFYVKPKAQGSSRSTDRGQAEGLIVGEQYWKLIYKK